MNSATILTIGFASGAASEGGLPAFTRCDVSRAIAEAEASEDGAQDRDYALLREYDAHVRRALAYCARAIREMDGLGSVFLRVGAYPGGENGRLLSSFGKGERDAAAALADAFSLMPSMTMTPVEAAAECAGSPAVAFLAVWCSWEGMDGDMDGYARALEAYEAELDQFMGEVDAGSDVRACACAVRLALAGAVVELGEARSRYIALMSRIRSWLDAA